MMKPIQSLRSPDAIACLLTLAVALNPTVTIAFAPRPSNTIHTASKVKNYSSKPSRRSFKFDFINHENNIIFPSVGFFANANLEPRTRKLRSSITSLFVSEVEVSSTFLQNGAEKFDDDIPEWIIQWRGEGTEGYSMALRNWEFTSAFRAELRDYVTIATGGRASEPSSEINATGKLRHFCDSVKFFFQDALLYQGPIFYPMGGDAEESGYEGEKTNLDLGEIERFDATPVDGEAEPIPLSQARKYESAMQYVTVTLPAYSSKSSFHVEIDHEALLSIFTNTIRRCSLIRTAFRIASEGESYDQLATCALKNGSFLDMMEGGRNEDSTWSLRLRRYGSGEAALSTQDGDKIKASKNNKKSAKQKIKVARYGKNVRSPLKDEKYAILSMVHLVARFKGKVSLANPDCKIYLLEGLQNRMSRQGEENTNVIAYDENRGRIGTMFLARVVAQGPKTSMYSPKTRICVTTTPLCPLASFTLSNIAQLSRISNPAVLDPFAGSCATLLAAAHITSTNSSSIFISPSHSLVTKGKEIQQNPKNSRANIELRGKGCRSVGIEFLHSGYVNRDNIVEDFRTRNLDPPINIIRGDCLSSDIRALARKSVGGSFDAIVTDPPYGIREAMPRSSDADENAISQDDTLPLTKLCYAIGEDRCKGSPLLKSGGRLVAFIPVKKGETLQECLPDAIALKVAGLKMDEDAKEQVLSDMLSRWIVSFVSE